MCIRDRVYRGVSTERLNYKELEEVRRNNWMNLADVGSMVASLVIACHYVCGERRQRYVQAVRRYLDDWAIRFRPVSYTHLDVYKRQDAVRGGIKLFTSDPELTAYKQVLSSKNIWISAWNSIIRVLRCV